MKLTMAGIFPPLIDFFFFVGADNLSSSRELDQNSEVAQACDRRDEQVRLIKVSSFYRELTQAELRWHSDYKISVLRKRERMVVVLLPPPPPQVPCRKREK